MFSIMNHNRPKFARFLLCYLGKCKHINTMDHDSHMGCYVVRLKSIIFVKLIPAVLLENLML